MCTLFNKVNDNMWLLGYIIISNYFEELTLYFSILLYFDGFLGQYSFILHLLIILFSNSNVVLCRSCHADLWISLARWNTRETHPEWKANIRTRLSRFGISRISADVYSLDMKAVVLTDSYFAVGSNIDLRYVCTGTFSDWIRSRSPFWIEFRKDPVLIILFHFRQ